MKKGNQFWSPNFMAEFRKWMDENSSENPITIGKIVGTNLKLRTLVERMDCQDSYENSVIDVAKHFLKHGGKVKKIQENNVTIQTKKGIFVLNKEDIIQN